MFKVYAPYVAEPYEPTRYYKYFLFREDAEKYLSRMKLWDEFRGYEDYYTFGISEIEVEDRSILEIIVKNFDGFKKTLST